MRLPDEVETATRSAAKLYKRAGSSRLSGKSKKHASISCARQNREVLARWMDATGFSHDAVAFVSLFLLTEKDADRVIAWIESVRSAEDANPQTAPVFLAPKQSFGLPGTIVTAIRTLLLP